jgi:hypothetical protein
MNNYGFSKSEWLDGRFVLERGLGGTPEGSSSEWREIVKAIREKRSKGFRRVGVFCAKDGEWFEICSPRNSYGRDDHFTLFNGEAEEFCKAVEDEIASHDEEFTEGGVI